MPLDDAEQRKEQLLWVREALSKSTEPSLPEAWQKDMLMREVSETILDLRHMLAELAKGNLEHVSRGHGHMCGTARALQANLRHLTWQVRCVADGEYGQRVDFMGDFSEAFNRMTVSLEAARRETDALAAEYKALLRKDSLTGCSTLTTFRESVTTLATEHSGVLLRMELDSFPSILLEYGMPFADAALREAGRQILQISQPQQLCCRTPDNSFLCYLPDTTMTEAAQKAEQLRHAVEEVSLIVHGHHLWLTASVGVTLLPATAQEELPAMLARAEQRTAEAVQRAVALGRNQIVCLNS